ncbi:TonB-dependent receptor, partial [bacterium]|nr:TonB-dependent receptor [bacterium]
VAGLRADFYRFDVDSNIAANSGLANAHQLSPKLTAIFGPWHRTEFYLNYGHGFHSNDARGTTLNIDPSSGTAAE